MGRRYDLDDILRSIVPNVYFQPPPSVTMQYPAIRYNLSGINKNTADNEWYIMKKRYSITLIYRDPDSNLPLEIEKLKCCEHVSHYVADNLYHDVFEIEF